MRIGVLGTGRVGGTLGSRWSQCGHEVVFGTRDVNKPALAELLKKCSAGTRAASHRDAVEASDVVLLATPWPAARSVLNTVGDLSGKVLIDCSNPLNADFSGLDLGFTTSAAEQIASWAPGARVVKAFNTASSATMANPRYDNHDATLFFCGDDAAAKADVQQLASDLGFQPVDAGGLKIARYLEPTAMLYIELAVRRGWGANCALKVLKR